MKDGTATSNITLYLGHVFTTIIITSLKAEFAANRDRCTIVHMNTGIPQLTEVSIVPMIHRYMNRKKKASTKNYLQYLFICLFARALLTSSKFAA